MDASEDFDRPGRTLSRAGICNVWPWSLELPLSEASGLQLILPDKFQWPN